VLPLLQQIDSLQRTDLEELKLLWAETQLSETSTTSIWRLLLKSNKVSLTPGLIVLEELPMVFNTPQAQPALATLLFQDQLIALKASMISSSKLITQSSGLILLLLHTTTNNSFQLFQHNAMFKSSLTPSLLTLLRVCRQWLQELVEVSSMSFQRSWDSLQQLTIAMTNQSIWLRSFQSSSTTISSEDP